MNEEHSQVTKLTRTARAYIESLCKPLNEYLQDGTPPATPENELANLPWFDIVGLIVLVILLALQIPHQP